MNLTNYYYYFKSAIPVRICDDIIRYGKQLKEKMGVTGGFGDEKLNEKQVKDLKKKRDRPNQRQQGYPSHGKVRKLSVTLTLSDPKEYKGGDLEFDFRNLEPDKPTKTNRCKGILPKGSLIVFPGFVWHRVRPVKKGTRYSLVVWNLGWPFK